MRLIFVILFLISLQSHGQVINASRPYRPFTVASCSYLLDTYSGAAAAYSLRKLDCDYTGYAIRVRRSSDNSEQDIGFTSNGDLDTAALKTFVSTNSGYVVTWYDQSGNSKNAEQSTAGNQPRIINSGVVERSSGMPTMYFIRSSSTSLATASSLFAGANTRMFWVVYEPKATASSSYALAGQSSGTNGTNSTWFVLQFRSDGANGDPYLATWGNDLIPGNSITLSPKIADASYIGPTASLYKNNSLMASGTKTFNTVNSPFYIGRTTYTTGEYAEAYISEVIVYTSDKSSDRGNIYSAINTYYSIY